MNETNAYILDQIRCWVWSGFYDAADVNGMIDDVLEDGADEAMLRAAVPGEFAEKAEAEKSWPRETDCDRLDAAFDVLNSQGFIALQNTGHTMSDGLDDVVEAACLLNKTRWRGYCFYHGQDVERAVKGGGLYLAFGPGDDDGGEKKCEIAEAIRKVLVRHGFQVDWNEDPEERIFIPAFDWKRRTAD